MNNRVYLDASFWIAYRDERQDAHAQAKEILPRLFRERPLFVTTMPVVCEIHAYFSRSRVKKRLVLDDLFSNPVVQIEEVSPTDRQQALQLLRTQLDKEYSLCDALSFVVMRRLQLKRALAFDDHFRQFGGFEIIN
jgi:predicted nucleic acid-binding protein